MRIKFKGEDLGEFSGQPRLAEARLIKREIGMLPLEFAEALQKGDPDATCMLVSIMLTRGGRPIAWDKIDGEYDDVETELNADERAQVAAAIEEMKKANPDTAQLMADALGKGENAESSEAVKPGSSGSALTDLDLAISTEPSPVTPPASGSTSA